MYCAKGTRQPNGSHSSCWPLDRFAIDFAADAYTPPKLLLAPAAGVVKAIRNCKQHSMFGAVEDNRCGHGWGNLVWIDHENGFTSQIAHVSAVLVADGARVAAGDPIGFEGNSGDAGGKHIHYTLRRGTLADMTRGAPSVFWKFQTANGVITQDDVTCQNWTEEFEIDPTARLNSANVPTRTAAGKWHY